MKLRFILVAFILAFPLLTIRSEETKQNSPQPFSFDLVKAEAEKLSKSPYKDTLLDLPPEIKYMNYDTYNLICCNRDMWKDPELNFEITFFPIGNLYQRPVVINEIIDSKYTEFKFSKDYFTFNRPTEFLKDFMPDNAGFAGFRIISKKPETSGEVVVFLGASYFRQVSPGSSYGLSARGLSINSGINDVKEEFPVFREFWIEKPKPHSDTITVYALMDSKSVSGAYKFVTDVKRDMTTKVSLVVFPREKNDNMGFAHLTSMFWINEVKTWPFHDFRPNIHNSDGLIISADNKLLWEPLVNYPYFPIIITDIPVKKLNYFGLLQRDRNFTDYYDPGVKYHLNPSTWFVPDGNWIDGKIRLVQQPTLTEWMDNINSMWMPEKPLEPGKPFELNYTMHTSLGVPEEKLARVVKTLIGKQTNNTFYTVSVYFEGGDLDSVKSADDVVCELKVPDKVKVERKPIVHKIKENNTYNVSLVISSLENSPWDKPADIIEMTLFDKNGKQLSETLYYCWRPYWREIKGP